MNKKLTNILHSWPRPYISGAELALLLDKSADSRHAIIKRAIKNEDIIPLKRDIYVIAFLVKTGRLDLFEIAGILYGPSYISFESALSFHGWIPEAVKSTTSATVKRGNEIETPFGVFAYSHIPTQAFPVGVQQHDKHGITIFIADPWKAIADMIYSQKRKWSSIDDLCGDLRIEDESVKQSDLDVLDTLVRTYPSPRVRKVLKEIQKGVTE